MDNQVKLYFNSKKKSYWKVWPITEGGCGWFLCFPEDVWEPSHYGNELTEEHCHKEIQWVISHYLDRKNKI